MSHFAKTKGAFQLPDLDQAALPTRCSKSEHFARTILSQVLIIEIPATLNEPMRYQKRKTHETLLEAEGPFFICGFGSIGQAGVFPDELGIEHPTCSVSRV